MFLECLYDIITFVVLCVCEPIGMERFETMKKKERSISRFFPVFFVFPSPLQRDLPPLRGAISCAYSISCPSQ